MQSYSLANFLPDYSGRCVYLGEFPDLCTRDKHCRLPGNGQDLVPDRELAGPHDLCRSRGCPARRLGNRDHLDTSRTFMEAYQASSILVILIIFLMVAQTMGLLFLSPLVAVLVGLVFFALDAVLIGQESGSFPGVS